MKFLSILIYTAFLIEQGCAKKLCQPSVEVVVNQSSNNIGINTHIELSAPQSDLNSTIAYNQWGGNQHAGKAAAKRMPATGEHAG
jgi:hypothetical protein